MATESKPRGRPRKNPEEVKPKGPNGGAREGAGRPKGSKNIYSYESVKRLQELGFDPIEEMVTQYESLTEMIGQSYSKKDGSPTHVTATLKSIQQKIINDLMQYGYRKMPEKIEQEITDKKPLAVKLTMKKEKADG